MSIKEPQPQLDEFEAFLQGEGELAAMLQELPQQSPSARLDAAIRTDAERAIERSRMPLPVAANDAIVPESARIKQPSFATRWRVPLGIVASIIIAMPLFMMRLNVVVPGQPRANSAAAPEVHIVHPALPLPGNQKKAESPTVPPPAPIKAQGPYIPPPQITIENEAQTLKKPAEKPAEGNHQAAGE